jgi:predicted DNA-binding transcriptional regulator YafY
LTKPLHSSQKLLKETQEYIMISIDVILNFELEREILGFGESMQVISPRLLAKRVKKRLDSATNLYEDAF